MLHYMILFQTFQFVLRLGKPSSSLPSNRLVLWNQYKCFSLYIKARGGKSLPTSLCVYYQTG